jgi:hypothetical protein
VTTVARLAVSDYVEVDVYQQSGASVNVESTISDEFSPEFAMAWIGP